MVPARYSGNYILSYHDHSVVAQPKAGFRGFGLGILRISGGGLGLRVIRTHSRPSPSYGKCGDIPKSKVISMLMVIVQNHYTACSDSRREKRITSWSSNSANI